MLEDSAVDKLISEPQYSMTYARKQERLLPILDRQVRACCGGLPAYDAYLRKMRFSRRESASYLDVPYLPVPVFKSFDLCAVPREQVARVLKSSGTTTGTPSVIYLDKTTAFRQAKALAATVMELIGPHRRPYLVLDCQEVNEPTSTLTARGAALRGFQPFASSMTYGLVLNGDTLEPSIPALEEFFDRHQGVSVLLSGFSFIIWTNLVEKLRKEGVRFHHPQMTLLHSGGWKRLRELRVEKSVFAEGVAELFGCAPTAVRDFYGMVEQVGVIFVDCEAGNKHTPNFAEVVIRDFLSLRHAEPGQSGLIEVLSVLPRSYPGQAILTEDVGTVIGYDDCPCGRLGMYFRFQSRVERAELRGCGDTFGTSQIIAAAGLERSTSGPQSEEGGELEFLVASDDLELKDAARQFWELRSRLLHNFDEYARLPVGAIVALLDSAGRNMASEECAGIEGIAFLSSWLRRNSLGKVLRMNFGNLLPALDGATEIEGTPLQAAPRGLVCHWVSGNVPTLAMFSWVLATLARNASILRVPQESREVVKALFRAVDGATAEYEGVKYDGGSLLARTVVLHFPSENARLGEAMSMVADARVIWGGSEALRAITAYPRMDHCEDVIFGPKFSLGVVDRATLQDENARRAALRALVRDAVLFDQAACSSPQVVFLESTTTELEQLADLVEEEFAAASRRFPKRSIQPYVATLILRTRAQYGLQADTSVRAPNDLSYTLLLESGAHLRDALQSRSLFLNAVEDIMQVVPLLSPKIQTIGVAIADPSKRAAFVGAAALRGVARCVQPGMMNNYEVPWDGMLPVSRLVRWCRS